MVLSILQKDNQCIPLSLPDSGGGRAAEQEIKTSSGVLCCVCNSDEREE